MCCPLPCGLCFAVVLGLLFHALPLPPAPVPQILRDGDIQFEPALSADRMLALRNIYFPNGAKVHLKFSKKFWPDDCAGMICSQTYGPEMWFQSAVQPDGTEGHMVTFFAMDYRADRMADAPLATCISLCLSQVCSAHHTRNDDVAPAPAAADIAARFPFSLNPRHAVGVVCLA